MRISDWSSDVCSSDLALDYHVRAPCMKYVTPQRPSVRTTPLELCLVSLVRERCWPLAGPSTAMFVSGIWLASCRSEEHTSELQSLMRISYAVFCLKKKKKITTRTRTANQ